MLLNTTNLGLLFSGYSFQFQQAYSSAPLSWLEKLVTRVPSDSERLIHFWLAQNIQMREWLGERQIQNLAGYEQVVVNKHYEATIGLDVNKVSDDTHGFFASSAIPALAEAARIKPAQMVASLLRAGGSTLCPDGQWQFDTDHPVSKFSGGTSGTQSNLFTSRALSYDNAVYVKSQMRLLKDEKGVELDVNPCTMFVPPQLEALAISIASSEYAPKAYGTPGSESAATQQPNVLKGTFNVEVISYAGADATTWYFGDTSRGQKPMCLQERKNPEFTSLVAPTDPNVFNLKTFLFGVDARWEACFGPWWLMAKAVA